MDCEAVRQVFDHPDAGEEGSAAAATVQDHVRQCPACQELLDSRDRFDARLSAVLRDVPVPPRLRDRLLLALAERSRSSRAASRGRGRVSRRLVLRAVACVSAVALAVSVWQFIEARRRPAQFDLAQLRAAAARLLQQAGEGIDLSFLPQFDGAFPLPNVKEWQDWARTADLRGVEIDGRGRSDAAAAVVPIGRGPAALGIYLIVPAGRISDVSLLATQPRVAYAPVAHAAWKSGDFVFVCITTQNHLDDLMRFAPGRTAA